MGLWGFSILLYLDTHDTEIDTMDALTSADPYTSGGGNFPPMGASGKTAEPTSQTPAPAGSALPAPVDDVDVDVLPSAKVLRPLLLHACNAS